MISYHQISIIFFSTISVAMMIPASTTAADFHNPTPVASLRLFCMDYANTMMTPELTFQNTTFSGAVPLEWDPTLFECSHHHGLQPMLHKTIANERPMMETPPLHNNLIYHFRNHHTSSPTSQIFWSGNLTQQNTFAVEIWFTAMPHETTTLRPIVTIGQQQQQQQRGGRSLRSSKGCPGYDWRLGQLGPFLHLSYTAASGHCESTVFTHYLNYGEPNHVMLSFTWMTTLMLLNGESISTQNLNRCLDPTLSNFQDDSQIFLYTHPAPQPFGFGPTAIFEGAIHAVDFYDEAVYEQADIQTLYQVGPYGTHHQEGNNTIEGIGRPSASAATSNLLALITAAVFVLVSLV